MIIFLLLISSGIAQCPGSEIGDGVFRPLALIDAHAAVYRCSKSTGYGIPDSIDIINSDFRHSVIQASGFNTVVGDRTFEYFLSGQQQIFEGYTAPIEIQVGSENWEIRSGKCIRLPLTTYSLQLKDV